MVRVLWAAVLALAQWPIAGCLACMGSCQWQSLPDPNLCKVGAATSASQVVTGPKGLVMAQSH